jgi:hypothetical protein
MSPPEVRECPGADACPIAQSHVKLTDETISYLRDLMRESVADGINRAMTQDAARRFWGVGLDMAQEQARMRAGRFVLDGLWAMLKKGVWVAIFVAAVYAIGGWALLTAIWKLLFGKT